MSATSGESEILHDYAEVNGVRLHYAHAGTGHERLIVFLHGFPEFWYAWKDQLALFGRDDHAVAPDLRGYNLSSKPAEVEAYRVRHVGEDIHALAEHLGHRRFALVGHDWGGAVAGLSPSTVPSAWSGWSSSTRRTRRSSPANYARTRRSNGPAGIC